MVGKGDFALWGGTIGRLDLCWRVMRGKTDGLRSFATSYSIERSFAAMAKPLRIHYASLCATMRSPHASITRVKIALRQRTAKSLAILHTAPQIPNFSKYLLAASTPSSTFPPSFPCPKEVAPFPPAFPPTISATAPAHFPASAPFPCASGET